MIPGGVVMMVDAMSRQNKGAGARSPSRQGHLWWRRRAASLVSSLIYGSGEGGVTPRDRALCEFQQSRQIPHNTRFQVVIDDNIATVHE